MKLTTCILFVSILFFDCVAQIGGVGINTLVPRAMLHVADSSVVFTGVNEAFINPGPTPVTGEGTRMMWYADKSAFRVGRVNGPNWDRDSIGLHSFAAGWNAKAKGAQSFALGLSTQALGSESVALGNSTKAIGGQSTTTGFLTTAFGFGSTAMGWQTVSNGFASYANGLLTTADGNYTLAMNQSTYAQADASTTLGRNTKANGYASLVAGMFNDTIVSLEEGNVPGNNIPLFIVGNGTDSNNRKNALVVRSNGKVGIGINAPAHPLHVFDPNPGVQLARFNSGGGYGEILVGNGTNRVDLGATTNVGYVGTKEPVNFTVRTGTVSRMSIIHSTGFIGIGSDSPEARLHVHMPVPNATLAKFTSNNGYAEIHVGNGFKTVEFGVAIAGGYIGTRDQGDLFIKTGGSVRAIVKDTTGNMGIGTFNPAAKLEVNGTAMKPGGGSWTATSDIRLKQNVIPYKSGLDAILAIRPVTYQYNVLSGMNTEEMHVGVIAQELQSIAPEMVSISPKKYTDGSTGYLQVDNSAMTYMLINAVKEQQEIIAQLLERIEVLEKQ